MRRRNHMLLYIVALLIAVSFLVPPAGAVQMEEEVRVVCANSILADFASNVIGDHGRVEYLMPAGVCPSHYDARPSDADMVEEADVIIMMGWEGWLNNIISSTGNDDALVIRCGDLGEQNLPEDVKGFVGRIAAQLGEAYPDFAPDVSANAAAYQASIDAKAEELSKRVEAEGLAGTKLVVMQWHKAFVESLGFEAVGAFGPPESLSVQDQLNVTETASRGDVVMVVDNLQSGTDFGALVAKKARKSHVVLTNFPDAAPGTYTYLDMIDYNTAQLIEGAQEYQRKQGEIADLEAQVEDLELQNTLLLTMAVIFLVIALFMGIVLMRSRSRGD